MTGIIADSHTDLYIDNHMNIIWYYVMTSIVTDSHTDPYSQPYEYNTVLYHIICSFENLDLINIIYYTIYYII